MKTYVLSLLLCIALGQASHAAVIGPWWEPGTDGSTCQYWSFDQDDPNPLPDEMDNPYGMPELAVYPGMGQEWMSQHGDRFGIWPLSGDIEVGIPNRPLPLPYKEIYVTLTWADQTPLSTPVVWEKMTGVDGELLGETIVSDPSSNVTWRESVYYLRLEPNPDFEIIRIAGSVLVDDLRICTICIPEPGSVALMGIGAMMLARRRR
jgi:hypothetical protein